MAVVGFSRAAALAGVSRQHLYKMADAGQISVTRELLPGRAGDNPRDFRQMIDISELQRVFGQIKTSEAIDTKEVQDANILALESELKATRDLLRDREEQLRKSEEREEWLKKKIDETQGVIKLIGHSQPREEVIPVEKYRKAMRVGQAQIDKLLDELEAEQSKGFWGRLFNR
jgi:hypothetical protein